MNIETYRETVALEPGITLNQSRFLNIFWSGFLIYTVGFIVGTTGTISIALAQLFQVFGLLLFIPSTMALIKFRLRNRYLQVIYTIYCSWLLVVVARGMSLDYVAIKNMLFDPYNGIFLYLVPFIILFPIHLSNYKKLFISITVLSIIYLLYDLMFINRLIQTGSSSRTMLEYFAKTLGIPAGFLLFTYVYQSKKTTIIAGMAILATLLLAIIGARRGLMFMTGVILIFSFIIYCYENRRRAINVVFSVLAGLFLLLYTGSMFYNDDIKLFTFAKERMDEDTRTMVELFFYDDMEQQDWLYGRGMNGLVAAPVSLKEDHVGGKPGYRDGIETDYLKIILKGGLISLGLLLLIAVPAIFLGIFYSKNILAKAAALWIILWMLSLYPTNVTNFTMNYLIVWLSIGFCYSKHLRNLPEELVRERFRAN